jgi:NadR type nicotinamide-nucleotide adenylyltransferase
VLIGPESTGKTTLAGELAAHYGVPLSAEHAREYVEQAGRPLRYEDVPAVARGQRANEDRAVARASAGGARLVIHDTDLVSTMVYSRHYYGDCPSWVESAARERKADLYLLLDVDVEWVADGPQRELPERRDELLARFRAALGELGTDVVEIHGPRSERRRRATQAVDRRLGRPAAPPGNRSG